MLTVSNPNLEEFSLPCILNSLGHSPRSVIRGRMYEINAFQTISAAGCFLP